MKKVPGFGPPNAKIMAVGEAPGANEEVDGRPFVGAAGQTMRKSLLSVGIDPDEIYMTNICRYRPPANKIRTWFDGAGRPNELVLQGMLELIEEINRIKPNVIIAFGNYPLWALTGLAQWKKIKLRDGGTEMDYTGISNWRGSIVECTLVPGFKVIPTFHPSYITREGYSDHGVFNLDLERIKKESQYPDLLLPQKEFVIDPQGSDRWGIADRLTGSDTSVITFDIEYIGSKLLCVGMTNHRDYAMNIKTDSESDLKFVRDVLLCGIPLNAQNSIYDASILEWWYKIPVLQHVEYDTMLAAHAANIELPKGLDFLCSVYTDQRFYKNMIDWDKVKAGKQSIMDVLRYNCIDVWTQHEIMEEQIKYDLDDPLVERIFRFEMQLQKILWIMSSRGVKVDVDKIHALKESLAQEVRLSTHALELFAGRPINVKSPKDIPWLLFDRLGLKPGKMNKTGPATDDKTIAEVKLSATTDVQRNVIELVRTIRRNRDLISKFLDIQFDEDGRMRGHYSPAGTVTGRLASRQFYPTGTGGNQQNIPRDKRVRSMFIPDPPKLFVYADLERAESLVVAQLTQDPEMLRVHAPGVDAHKELAAVLFNKPAAEITEDERYMGKQTRHAGNYMQGPRTFMTNVNKVANKTGVAITYDQAKRYINIYRELHGFLGRWWKDVESELWRSRTLYNLVGPDGKGRRRIFYGHIRGIVPEAVAYVPQSTVGDTLNVALLNLAAEPCEYMKWLDLDGQYNEWAKELIEYGYEPLMQVHDAVGAQINEKDAERALWLMDKLMTVPLTVPKTLETFAIPVEILVGPSWGQVKKWEPTPLVAGSASQH